MDKLQEELDNWAIQELNCSPVYDGEIGARDVVIGWRCHIINRGWYEGTTQKTIVEAIESALAEMEYDNDSFGVVLMPPKKSRVVQAKVVSRKKTEPLIYLEED